MGPHASKRSGSTQPKINLSNVWIPELSLREKMTEVARMTKRRNIPVERGSMAILVLKALPVQMPSELQSMILHLVCMLFNVVFVWFSVRLLNRNRVNRTTNSNLWKEKRY
jgi:hypothetical protein